MSIKTELHRRLLNRYSDHPSVIPLIDMWPSVEQAIDKVLEDGNYNDYVEAITPYDKHIWTESKKPEESNPIAYKKWKIYPSWSELNWAIVYEVVRKKLHFETKLIRTDKVLEGATSSGEMFYKDVDGGLAIVGKMNNKKVLFPVVVMEHKGGHFCKTACTGVNGIARRFHDANPNVITVQATENNVSVGVTQSDSLIKDIDCFIVDRGVNNLKKDKKDKKIYYPRNVNEMYAHEKYILEQLSKATPKHFLNVKIEKVSSKTLREQLAEINHISKEKEFVDILTD